MRQRKSFFTGVFSLACLAALAACSMLPGVPGTGGTGPAPEATIGATAATGAPAAEPSLTSPPPAEASPRVVTVMPGTGGAQTAAPVAPGTPPAGANTAAPTGTHAAVLQDGGSITLADQGKTIQLKVGQRFLLNLGADYNWNPVVADQRVVSRVIGVMVIRGAQGLYEAHAAGTTRLTADGEPACRQARPACAMPSRLFEVTLVVRP